MKSLSKFILMLLMGVSVFAKETVNVYTHRHYDSDKKLFKQFEEETGIKVNVVKGNADELIKKLEIEGKDSPADILITVDAGRLQLAKEKDLLQPVTSEILKKNIPSNLKDRDNNWYGLTYRARILAYDPSKTDVSELSTYEDLANPKWKNKILTRSSTNLYNQSLIASIIANDGEKSAYKWAEGLVENFARDPKGNDRDQAKAVISGEGEIAIMNSYYMGKMLTSKDPKEVEVAKKLRVFFPNQDGRGTHINVSGIGVTRYAKNKANAVKFIEFLSDKKSQKVFAEANFEYPVNPQVEASDLVKSFGEFKADSLDLTLLGENNINAVKIADKAGWK